MTEDPADPCEDYPDVWEEQKTPELLLEIGGNEAFKVQNFNRDLEKYQKLLTI